MKILGNRDLSRKQISVQGGIFMKSYLSVGNKYLKKSSWRDLAVIKFCLFAMGLLAGMSVREKDKKTVRIGAATVFAVTYVPLMAKLFKIMDEE